VFVINEWLWSDLSGSNHAQAQRETFKVIESLPESIHQIVVIEGSPFDRKTWNLCRNDNPMIVQRIAGAYVANVRQNSDRCILLKPDAVVALPRELAQATNPDDHYLVQAALSVRGSVLVTTDGALHEALRAVGLNVISRDEFLDTYF
jgi:hypothetical protein